MSYEVQCPQGHLLQVSDAHAGKQVRCPTCGETFVAARPGAPPPLRDRAGQPPEAPQIDTGEPVRRLRPGLNLADLGRHSMTVGRPALMLGLLLVLLARGCDTIGRRAVDRAKGKINLARNRFSDEWEAKRLKLTRQTEDIGDEIDAIIKKDPQTDQDRTRMEQLRKQRTDLQEQVSDLREKEQEAQRELERGDWRDLSIAARDAAASNDMSSYWREMLFVFGSVVLAFGLLLVSWNAQGAERWICLIMLAIITFSLYVGGIAWIAGARLP